MTREEFGVCVKKLKAVYAEPWFMPDRDAFDAWFELVKDLNYKSFAEATDRYILDAEKPPTPGGLIRYYREIDEEWKTLKRDLMNGWEVIRSAYQRNGGIVEPGTLRLLYEQEFKHLPRSEQFSAFSDFVRSLYAYMDTEAELPTMEAYIRGLS